MPSAYFALRCVGILAILTKSTYTETHKMANHFNSRFHCPFSSECECECECDWARSYSFLCYALLTVCLWSASRHNEHQTRKREKETATAFLTSQCKRNDENKHERLLVKVQKISMSIGWNVHSQVKLAESVCAFLFRAITTSYGFYFI